MQSLQSQVLTEVLVARDRESPPLIAPALDEAQSWSSLSLRIANLPDILPEIETARLARDLVTVLTTPTISVDLRLDMFNTLVDRFQISAPRVQSILSHALEIAILEDQDRLVAALESVNRDGARPRPTFFQRPVSVGDGADASVYAISEFLVAKHFEESGRARAYLGCSGDKRGDFVKSMYLFQRGVSVPRPVRSPLSHPELSGEVGECSGPSVRALAEKGLVMEKINGHCPGYPKSYRERLPYALKAVGAFISGRDAARFKEIWKSMRLGFKPRDFHRGNMILSEELDKTFLIDVSRWGLSRKLAFLDRIDPFRKENVDT